jgi:hypothetical protein
MLWKIAALVFIAGCIGGSITGLVAHEGSKKIKKSKNTSSGETGEQEPGKLLFAYKNPGCMVGRSGSSIGPEQQSFASRVSR